MSKNCGAELDVLGGLGLLLVLAAAGEQVCDAGCLQTHAVCGLKNLVAVFDFVERKFEPKFNGNEFAPDFFSGMHVVDGFVHAVLNSGFFFCPVDAFVLQGFQFGLVGFHLIAEAALLEGEVGEVAAVGHEDFAGDERFAGGGVGLFGVEVGEFEQAEGVDAGFERGDAEDAPFGVGNHLHERVFLVGGGGFLFEVAVEMGLVSDGIVCWEEDGLAGESGFDGVQR